MKNNFFDFQKNHNFKKLRPYPAVSLKEQKVGVRLEIQDRPRPKNGQK